MLSDARYRAWVVRQVKDPVVRSFWLDEFGRYDERFLREAIAPIQNKVGQLLMAPPIRNIFGQVKGRFDARFTMDRGRIFIANLSKGLIGDDKANLLGSLLVTQFQLAAMERADMPESDRRDFYFHIDEFHNFSTDSFAAALSESRKYRFALTLSHQYINQVRVDIRNAVLGNVGNLVIFRVGQADAEVLELELAGEYTAGQLADQSNYSVHAKLLSDGAYGASFQGRTWPAHSPKHGRRARIIARSRERYATPRAVVEERIQRWIRP
jgi:hypothetical protein